MHSPMEQPPARMDWDAFKAYMHRVTRAAAREYAENNTRREAPGTETTHLRTMPREYRRPA